ncbi:phosphoribosylamine--glycine ligase [Telmatospirillum siberiense]|uniref:Phosphoribosylamine--glycine ligase n=1 Tax=Telmatospirillum siberiense TaxID=382514 RepID=A0A2N3Q085_9PROT|nr:phosphoribosylamine--glycine ligase [Telmatospirillum siberiense]PKU26052.1 phosphoribosylamine--glycine ligase [Telmatospirillum siberiense]
MKILVVGSGGREHALCWAIRRSPLCTELLCAPGNAGIAEFATLVPIGVEQVDDLTAFARTNAVDFVVIGPEAPLVLGLADKLAAAGVKAFGPSAAAAALEGSKGFMKDILAKYDIPTAGYGRFTDADAAKAFIRAKGAPIVVKTDGLAAGKGVVVATSLDEALAAVDAMMGDKLFGAAGDELVIEEFLTGEEASFFAIVDGTTALPLAAAQDHKRVGDGDTGPNTGGMGAYSPAPVVTPDIEAKVMERCILPTVRGMAAEGRPYRGILFAGLMIDEGEPKLLEYNVRFGDPECQVLMARLASDIVALMLAAAEGQLAGKTVEWSDDPALVVVMAAKGYPGSYRKGSVIEGLDQANQVEGVRVLHAGTERNARGQIVATGGRVLGITASGASVAEAQTRAYQAIDRIRWPEGFCRRDIGWRAIKR